jgi:hypothetical protein
MSAKWWESVREEGLNNSACITPIKRIPYLRHMVALLLSGKMNETKYQRMAQGREI